MASLLPLVDVNASNADTTWPLLLKAVKDAHFISLDLELSGLGNVKPTAAMEQHYQQLCAVVSSRAILSMGVGCFRWGQCECVQQEGGEPATSSSTPTPVPLTPVPLTAQVFNIWLLTQQPFVTDPSSAKFLIQHGFDFNKQYSLGLPYTPPPSGNGKTPPPLWLDKLFALLLHCNVPVVLHNGWLDLLFLYRSCCGPLPTTSASFMADILEMFPAGVYDTKAIAQFKFREEATFLLYIFRKCQLSNSKCCHVAFEFPMATQQGVEFIEHVEIAFPPPLPPQQLALLHVCDTFAWNGYCNTRNCGKVHDVGLAIQQAELSNPNRRRKRKRGHKGQKKVGESCDAERKDVFSENADSADMTTLFREDLTAIRAKLGGASHDAAAGVGVGTLPDRSLAVSCGHRAGFDAFMTGYSFSWYAAHYRTQDRAIDDTAGGAGERELLGLSDMRNKLASRPGNWRVPLQLLKSHFAKTSSTLASARERFTTTAESVMHTP